MNNLHQQQMLESLCGSHYDDPSKCVKYTWKIPSISNYTKDLLCNGFTRIHYNKHIISPIINLFAKYYTNDLFSLNQIKNSHFKQCFHSPIFVVGHYLFYLEIFPNGSYADNIGKILIYLCLISNKTNQTILLKYNLKIKETNTESSQIASFKHSDGNYSAWNNTLSSIDIQLLQSLTIIIDINILGAIENNSFLSLNNIMNNQLQTAEELDIPVIYYKWSIKDNLDKIQTAAHSTSFYSNSFLTHGFKWQLELAPNGDIPSRKGKCVLFLGLLTFPSKIDKISVKYQLSILETGSSLYFLHDFKENSMSWGTYSISTFDNIKQIKSLTIMVELMIVQVFSKNNPDIDIADKYHEDNIKDILLPKPITYKWNITQNVPINQIKNAVNGDVYFSEPFKINDALKFGLDLHPNGDTLEKKDSFCVYLRLISKLPNISKLSVYYKLFIDEIDINWGTSHDFTQRSLTWGWSKNRLKKTEINDLNTLTIRTEITIIDVYDNNNDKIDNYVNDNIKICGDNAISAPLAPYIPYVWEISDKNNLIKMQNAPNVYSFSSDIFEIYGVKWCIGCWPNGSRTSRIGTINLFLNLCSFRSSSIAFVIKFTLSFIESNKTHQIYHTFSMQNNCTGGIDWPLKTNDLLDLNSFGIKVGISLIDVFENNKIITAKYRKSINCNQKPKILSNIASDSYKWSISNNEWSKMKVCVNGVEYESKIFKLFGMKWFMKIYPNGKEKDDEGFVNIFIYNISLKNNKNIDININDDNDIDDEKYVKSKSLDVICLRYSICVDETNTRFIGITSLDVDKNEISWGSERIDTNRCKTVDIFTIDLKIELIGAYQDGKNITNEYTKNLKY